MDIYIASSWKNQHAVEMLTDQLEIKGHVVHSFVRHALEKETRVSLNLDLDAWIMSDSGKEEFDYDTHGATQSDLVIYIGPSGTDAWAEVGAAWARKVPIIGLWAKGEPSGIMRRMVCWYYDYRAILDAVDTVFAPSLAHIAGSGK